MRSFFRPAFRAAALLLLAAASSSALAQVGPPRSQQFPFAVGGGGEWVTDNGRTSDVKAFSNGGWHAFGEIVLEPGVLLQVRYMSFTLPGTPVPPAFGPATSAPDVRVNAGLMSVGYLFREPWWDGGFFGGVGAYSLNPQSLSGDQTLDGREGDRARLARRRHGGVPRRDALGRAARGGGLPPAHRREPQADHPRRFRRIPLLISKMPLWQRQKVGSHPTFRSGGDCGGGMV